MMLFRDLLIKPPSFEDIWYFIRNGLLRPRDIPGILRREARRRKAGKGVPPPLDPYGQRVFTEAWETALRAGVFMARPLNGPTLLVTSAEGRLMDFVGPMQTAGDVRFLGVENDPLFPIISFEAGRLGLRQAAGDPDAAMANRLAWLETATISDQLRDKLRELAKTEIGAA